MVHTSVCSLIWPLARVLLNSRIAPLSVATIQSGANVLRELVWPNVKTGVNHLEHAATPILSVSLLVRLDKPMHMFVLPIRRLRRMTNVQPQRLR